MISFSGIGSDLHQFSGCADERAGEAELAAHSFDAALDMQVVNVDAVPREKILHAVNGGEGNVDGIARGFDRDGVFDEQVLRQGIGPGRIGKLRDACEFTPAFRHELRVSLRSLAQGDAGNEQAVVLPLGVPPLAGRLLVCERPSPSPPI